MVEVPENIFPFEFFHYALPDTTTATIATTTNEDTAHATHIHGLLNFY